MDRLIELIEQWEDGKGLKDENIIDFLSEVKDFEKELLKALLMRLRSYTKNLELYRLDKEKFTVEIKESQFQSLSKLVNALETLKTEMESSNEFKEYVENMLIFNFDEYSIEEIIDVVYDHIYPLY